MVASLTLPVGNVGSAVVSPNDSIAVDGVLRTDVASTANPKRHAAGAVAARSAQLQVSIAIPRFRKQPFVGRIRRHDPVLLSGLVVPWRELANVSWHSLYFRGVLGEACEGPRPSLVRAKTRPPL